MAEENSSKRKSGLIVMAVILLIAIIIVGILFYSGNLWKNNTQKADSSTPEVPQVVQEEKTDEKNPKSSPVVEPIIPKLSLQVLSLPPEELSATNKNGQVIKVGQVKITANQEIKFLAAEINCSGDLRAVGPVFIGDNKGYTWMPGLSEQPGGFNIFVGAGKNAYILRSNESIILTLQLGIKDSAWDVDAANYPVKVSCKIGSLVFEDTKAGKILNLADLLPVEVSKESFEITINK